MNYFFDKIILPIFVGLAVAFFVFFIGAMAYLIPPLGVLFAICILVSLLASNPEWINKFWKQKEYRE